MPREYTYGPFASRRLGLSLGVDILPRIKTCTYNCVYCEIGSTIGEGLVSPYHRVKKRPTPDFRRELLRILKYFPHLDSITFGYNGEPTLNEYLLDFFKIAKSVREELSWKGDPPKLTLFTNSSTLFLKEIRERVMNFEIILAKLDGANEEELRKTNRPHEKVPTIHEIINSLLTLRKELSQGHELVLQCLLYNSYQEKFPSNYNNENIESLLRAVRKIKPKKVQLYTVARIPLEPHVYALSRNELEDVAKLIRDDLNDLLIEIISY